MVLAGNPHGHATVNPFIVAAWPDRDLDLEGHPFVRKIAEAVARGRELGSRLYGAVEAIGTRARVLQLDVGSIDFIERLVRSMRG